MRFTEKEIKYLRSLVDDELMSTYGAIGEEKERMEYASEESKVWHKEEIDLLNKKAKVYEGISEKLLKRYREIKQKEK